MAELTLETLKNYLERFGWKNYKATDEPYEKEGLIYTGWQISEHDAPHPLIIDPTVETKVLKMFSPLGKVSPEDEEKFKEVGLLFSLFNSRMILGKFALFEDGKMLFELNLPIENGLDYEKFEHALMVIVKEVEEKFPLIDKVLKGALSAKEAFFELESQILAKEALRKLVQETLSSKGN